MRHSLTLSPEFKRYIGESLRKFHSVATALLIANEAQRQSPKQRRKIYGG
jgi:hypothetical protein